MKKVLTLILALGLVVAFTSAAVAMGICGGPKAAQLQANADTNTQPDPIVVAQAEMTEDTSTDTSTEGDGASTDEETSESN